MRERGGGRETRRMKESMRERERERDRGRQMEREEERERDRQRETDGERNRERVREREREGEGDSQDAPNVSGKPQTCELVLLVFADENGMRHWQQPYHRRCLQEIHHYRLVVYVAECVFVCVCE